MEYTAAYQTRSLSFCNTTRRRSLRCPLQITFSLPSSYDVTQSTSHVLKQSMTQSPDYFETEIRFSVDSVLLQHRVMLGGR